MGKKLERVLLCLVLTLMSSYVQVTTDQDENLALACDVEQKESFVPAKLRDYSASVSLSSDRQVSALNFQESNRGSDLLV